LARTKHSAKQVLKVAILSALVSVQALHCLPVLAAASSNPGTTLYASTSAQQGLTPGAKEAATLLGILPKVEQLIQMRDARGVEGPITDQEMALKVDVLDRVLRGSLEVRMVSDRIDRELAWAFNGQGMLQGRKQKTLNYLFAANFMQGGILGIVSGPMFLHGLPIAGTDLLLLASSIGLGLSTISFVGIMKSPGKKIDGETTVLANIFQLEQPEPTHRLDTVVKFMHSVPPESTDHKTRVEKLIADWKKGHYLTSMKETHLKKLAVLQPEAGRYKEHLGLIGNRIRMLFDTQWTVEQLDEEMLDILRAVDIN